MFLEVETERVIGAAIEVHKTLGPGLLESVYELALEEEFLARNIVFERQKPVPIRYRGLILDTGLRLDFVIARQIVVLASDELSGHVTGEIVTVAGGMEGRVVHADD